MERVAELLKEKGYKAEVRIINKNGHEVRGLCLGQPDSNIMATIYEDSIYFRSNDIEDIVQNLIDEIIPTLPTNNVNILPFSNWESAKDKLRLCIMGYQPPKDAIYTPFLNLYKYVRIFVNEFSEPNTGATVVAVNDMVKNWGVTVETVFETARINSEKEYKVQTIADALKCYTGDEITEMPKSLEMVVLSNKSNIYGAAAMTSDIVTAAIGRLYGEKSYYILPSSIHEVIAIPDSPNISIDDLGFMVKNVNDTEVAQKDILSYSVYKYDIDTGSMEIVY